MLSCIRRAPTLERELHGGAGYVRKRRVNRLFPNKRSEMNNGISYTSALQGRTLRSSHHALTLKCNGT